MLRTIAAGVAGFVTLGMVVLALQSLSALVYPLPEGLNPMDPASADAFREHLEAMPPLAWAIGFGSELLGALAGALVAAGIQRQHVRPLSGVIVGLAFAGSVMNWMSFYHPTWFIVGQVIGYPLVLLAVWRLFGGGPRGGEAAA